MAKYCPSCGAEVKEGFKICLSCGAQLQANAASSTAAKDTVDSKTFEDQVAAQPEAGVPVAQPQQAMPLPVMPGQTYGQSQTHTPMQPKKSNSKLIFGVIVAVVAIVVVLLVVFLFLGGGGTSSDFVGTWIVESIVEDGASQTPSDYITFQSDGTFLYSGATGTWELKNNKIYIYTSSSGSYDDIGFDYYFSNNRLTLNFNGLVNGEYHTLSMMLRKS